MEYQPFGALYIHVPFCRQRCRYCDFHTQALSLDDESVRNYVDDLLLKIRHAGKDGSLKNCKTVYLGGGTPSYLGQRYLTEILYMLSMSMNLLPEMEITMEANPDSLSLPLVKDIWAMGVNRLSIGVQSFQDEILNMLGRIHDGQAAKDAINLAQERFENISIDLICGIPGQTTEGFLEDIETALDLGVRHISIYPLMVEEGTELERMVSSGQIEDVDDDIQADMMHAAAKLLASRGMQRYEVASYAYPGYESRHNTAYWTGVPYLGLGSGAVTMIQNETCRQRIQDDLTVDLLNRKQMTAEDLMLGMRMSQGLSFEKIRHATEILPDLPKVLEALSDRGLVEKTQGSWIPTDLGWLCGNELYGDLLDLAP